MQTNVYHARSKIEDLTELYFTIDDFWNLFKLEWEKHLIATGESSYFKRDFSLFISYSQFVYWMKGLFDPLFAYLLYRRGHITGIAFIDSTAIAICRNKRIMRNRIFKRLVRRGKTTAGWFYGFKLHLIINDRGEILAFQLTSGNVVDIALVEKLSRGIFGKLFGDKGYIPADLAKKLLEK